MLIMRRVGEISFFMEVKLCRLCMRTFCLNTAPYVMFSVNGMIFHMHAKCPPLKQSLPKLLEGE